MGFWLFILFMNLICPLTMIGFGKFFIKKAPKKVNSVFGYRTRMSSINRDTWEFAHKYFGKIWYISGFAILPPSIFVLFLFIGKNNDVIGNAGAVVETVQILLLLSAIIPTERALRRHFDKNGKRKETI